MVDNRNFSQGSLQETQDFFWDCREKRMALPEDLAMIVLLLIQQGCNGMPKKTFDYL